MLQITEAYLLVVNYFLIIAEKILAIATACRKVFQRKNSFKITSSPPARVVKLIYVSF